MISILRTRIILAIAVLLLLVHAGVIGAFGASPSGSLSSDLVQLALGVVLIYAIAHASRRSEGLAKSFWRLTAVAYFLWFTAQSLGVYNDLTLSVTVSWFENLLFCFWFVPLAMAIVLDPERESGRLDALTALDFVQAVLLCVAAYLYFFYLPRAAWGGGLSHEVWKPYFAGYAVFVGAFLLRAGTSRSRDIRALFGRMGMFLALSGCVDALSYYGPTRGLETGRWFDLLWSVLLVIPAAIACTWKQAEAPEFALDSRPPEKHLYGEIFYLMFPLLVLLMAMGIARERLDLAGGVVLLSFMCSSARLLATQHRMHLAKETLRREAARDSLTGLWNHKSILEILDRELLRAERDAQPVGLIMADLDDFKNINDSRGHAAGDDVLRIVASSIAAMVRPYDSVGRYGGEEFLVVAPGCGLAETWELAERVRCQIAECKIIARGKKVQVTVSLGIATSRSATDCEKLLRSADEALYLAKNAGRNRVEPRMQRAVGAGCTGTANSDFWV